MKHTPEPWEVKQHGNGNELFGGTSPQSQWYLFEEATESNAARIVACVNACKGMGNPEDDIKRYKKALSSCLYYLQKIANMPEYRQDEIDYLAGRGVLELEHALPDIFPDL
jgi:hypothetical protein